MVLQGVELYVPFSEMSIGDCSETWYSQEGSYAHVSRKYDATSRSFMTENGTIIVTVIHSMVISRLLHLVH